MPALTVSETDMKLLINLIDTILLFVFYLDDILLPLYFNSYLMNGNGTAVKKEEKQMKITTLFLIDFIKLCEVRRKTNENHDSFSVEYVKLCEVSFYQEINCDKNSL